MKTKILSGLICCLGIFSANAQTITAPVGQSLTVTNPIDVTGGGINISNASFFKIGGSNVLGLDGTSLYLGDSPTASTGINNTFIGTLAGKANTTGQYNTFFGSNAGRANTSGNSNIFIGLDCGITNTTGYGNMFLGVEAGRLNLTGNSNTFVGAGSGYKNNAGYQNVFLGIRAGENNVDGGGNTFIGYEAGVLVANANLVNATAIGRGAKVSISDAMILGNNVNVGIGNSAPTAKLEITSASGSGLKFTNLTSGSATTSVPGGKVLGVDGAGNVVLVQISGATTSSTGTTAPVADATWKNQDGYLYNNSTNGVVINGSGLEGNALIVKGGVLSKEVNVKVEGSESWPDYVFKPSYKRMSLDEVEKFININGHLPNVPSATEMVANGNNLGKTDVKLLEKVEELTLYLLEMKKANEVQNAEIQNLKKQVKSLRKK